MYVNFICRPFECFGVGVSMAEKVSFERSAVSFQWWNGKNRG
ncbi:hypothetical protein JCM19231_2752 [Vibrio ishigakensis]|uniref:Uncharacterized protein n=1 Tax=Vibrio ishigakensis TaxID=1481914 RepID=A0A0B8P414_9VIBR|nr:hypothetical protein JCM19231_2752 [Vibrio ishigakensis]